MTSPLLATGRRTASGLPLLIALAVVIAFFIGGARVAFLNTRMIRESAQQVAHTYEIISSLQSVLTVMKDAETGQRGFVITGDEKYLEPYNGAVAGIEAQLVELSNLNAGSAEQLARLPIVREQVGAKMRELAESIALRRAAGFEAARALVITDRGKNAMDIIRRQIGAMEDAEKQLLAARFALAEVAYEKAVRSTILSGLVGVLLALGIAWVLRRAALARQRLEWLQVGRAGLSEKVLGEQRVDQVGENSLRFLCEYLGAKAGALFLREDNVYRRCAAYALAPTSSAPERFKTGQGLLGQAAKDGKPVLVRNVPPNYFSIGSGLGQGDARELLIAPTKADGEINGVIELGFFEPIDEAGLELLAHSAESVGVALRTARSRARIVELLEETQQQAEEMQTQAEELRVTNEELEEQSNALKKSQAELEEQQAELEQSNLQLEEQTRLLEAQKGDLTQAKLGLENQSRVAEQASRYKSNFLANMSHELRTPLNSSLILAQLLAENRTGNLTEEQVKFARTIQSSGNDLLVLINDVLDLAKIEAGHMTLNPQRVELAKLLGSLRSQFDPIAQHRGLALKFSGASSAPATIETDPQRLEQVLRNLLSNALKFTEKGAVSLEISGASDGRAAFAVKDTGIGIDAKQQQLIFEPFRQADGTTSRKYGGTGLGLSISRELTQLLGGEIKLESAPGRGSTFTVFLPSSPSAPRVEPAPAREPAADIPPPAASSAVSPLPGFADDRQRLDGSNRAILIVEDDPTFAEILVNLAHEKKFLCLRTASAKDALALAKQYQPSAVLLDVGLPDDSGLSVLERLKNDPRTRHIPVHVISGSDYAEKALGLGAVGYMLKPVPRDQLVEAFNTLEQQLTGGVRRVLVVEDDAVQRDALCHLLTSREVDAVGAQDAAHCLEQLRLNTFDCIVLDLSLPDASGFSLLEKISADDIYQFPPVIVYTGRELSSDEEQRLLRYSKSIIIKGAKSPERLLDEVTLFLHQVVSKLPVEQQRMIEKARSREDTLKGRRILIAEDDVRNVFALTSIFEPLGVTLEIARNGKEALTALDRARDPKAARIDLVLMDIMMPEMDGLTAMREIRQRPECKGLPIIALTAKAMPNDQQQCIEAGANDYLAKPLNVDKLLSLVRVWMAR